MSATGIWLGNTAWPSNRSLKAFAEDVFRLSGAKTDKEKALAFYDWMTRCMRRGGPNPVLNDGCGGYSRYFDPLVVWASWGDGECTFWGWIAVEALCHAGMKARRVVAHNSGHTFYEVFYRGEDGQEQWHAFDPFGGWYFLNEHGEVASCAADGGKLDAAMTEKANQRLDDRARHFMNAYEPSMLRKGKFSRNYKKVVEGAFELDDKTFETAGAVAAAMGK